MHSLHRVLGAALYPGVAWHVGNGPAHCASGLGCFGAGVVDYQESAVEGCAAGEDGVVDFGVVGWLVGGVQALSPVAGNLRGEESECIVAVLVLCQHRSAKIHPTEKYAGYARR